MKTNNIQNINSNTTNHNGDVWSLRYKTPCVRGLYLHIPFCASKCSYCDFASWKTLPNTDVMRKYVIALQHQVEHMSWLGLLDETSTVYVGGGTPTFIGDYLWWLVQTVNSHLNISEMTVEANPESTNPYILSKLKDNGVTRISCGVQSLNDSELKLLGRIHDSKQAKDAIRLAKSYGFDVSGDLMCAIPTQTMSSWEHTLLEMVSLDPSHVSVYPLQIEEGTPFCSAIASGKMDFPEDNMMADCMDLAHDILESNGYSRYEVASYAKPGCQCAHNKTYWTGKPYLGLGTGASSCLSVEGYLKLKSVVSKLPDINLDTFRVRLKILSNRYEVAESTCIDQMKFEVEFLNKSQAIAEDLMLGARLVKGISPSLVDVAKDVYDTNKLDTTIGRLEEDKLVEIDSLGYIKPTHKGWLLGNQLYGELWDLSEGNIDTYTV